MILLFQAQPDATSSLISTIIMFVAIFLIFYFLIIRPQQKRAKEHQKLIESLKKGDKVITSSGIHGKVVGLDDKTVLIEVDDGVKIKFEKAAIAAVTREGQG
ncbi:protein translocase subunit yajC [Candidatus Kryptonium thompsonii]|uniref:Sec translocon accessory complex subunit YajC n=1 Tax=Candidatus Kryptonium thompsonii TaxID=1633631 RepID=A0A0P1LX18_9BACT|nr:preprotein translocase subunit YajC [Candidatus Kryptonium thompsoni]CUS84275.1 protein translocase subunit yajC [Candidatus Kryptonium thompsoni]CUS85854.1 protein translocase subunit yajC [Candidatus Kryptonium thompsoni]CUS86657.1 protein translocase subunit yajC [Candidatus Kryptonium thompsoni]CUS93575.1 protein translocase subunit yajC [Candidatus Kryptonium thompsoni]CUT04625.1 protein translocase subunit yajC [Candidatus Kryptonium thompsoni]